MGFASLAAALPIRLLQKRAYEAANAPAPAAVSPAAAQSFIAPAAERTDDDRPDRLH